MQLTYVLKAKSFHKCYLYFGLTPRRQLHENMCVVLVAGPWRSGATYLHAYRR